MTKTKKSVVINFIFLALLGLVPLLFKDNNYYLNIICMVFIWAGLALSWNMVGGFMGQITFAHMAFFGIGAYTVGIMYKTLNLSPWLGLIAAMLVSTIASVIISWPTLRIRGPFFVLITQAFLNICRILAIFFKNLTGGTMGITLGFKPSAANMMFRSKLPYIYIAFGVMVIIAIITMYLQRSKLGYQVLALREDREAAMSLGISLSKPRLIVACISAAMAGLVGGVYMMYSMYLEPDTAFSMNTSTRVVLMAIIGGCGTLWGPIIGAILLTPLADILRGALTSLPGLDQFIFGTVLIIVILTQPDGLVGGISAYIRKRKLQKNEASAAPEKEEAKEGR